MSSNDDAEKMWEVSEILAERQAAAGATELLVTWKATWVPVEQVSSGPVKEAWRLQVRHSSPCTHIHTHTHFNAQTYAAATALAL